MPSVSLAAGFWPRIENGREQLIHISSHKLLKTIIKLIVNDKRRLIYRV
jgi:hypothetical protein